MARKLLTLIVGLLVVAALMVPAIAAVVVSDNGTQRGVVEKINFTTGFTTTRSGGIATVVLKDVAIYSATSGTSLNRTVCIDSAGKFFSSATACP